MHAEIRQEARAPPALHGAQHSQHRIFLWDDLLPAHLARPSHDRAEAGITKMLGHRNRTRPAKATRHTRPLPIPRVQRDIHHTALLARGPLIQRLVAVQPQVAPIFREEKCGRPKEIEHRADEVAIARPRHLTPLLPAQRIAQRTLQIPQRDRAPPRIQRKTECAHAIRQPHTPLPRKARDAPRKQAQASSLETCADFFPK